MRWTKIKNIIILLLVLVNLFLLALVGLRAWRSQRGQRETWDQMIAVLEQNQISFLPQDLPGELTLEPRRVTLAAPGQSEAELLLGADASGAAMGSRTFYTGSRGNASFSATGEMEAALLPGAFPLADGEAAQALLASLGVQAELLEAQVQEDGVVFTFRQTWNGAPLPDWTATLECREGALERLTLRRLAGEEEVLALEEPITAVTALARFLQSRDQSGYVCSQVTALYPGYIASGTETVTLSPAWFIQTDTWRFAVDGQTGVVTAAE